MNNAEAVHFFERIAANFTTLPGWSILVESARGRFHSAGLAVTISFDAPHSNGDGLDTPVTRTWFIAADDYRHLGWTNAEQFMVKTLDFYVRWLSEHEVCEWNRYKGKFITDPHPEVKELGYGR